MSERKMNLTERNAAFMIMIETQDKDIFLELYQALTCDSSTKVKRITNWDYLNGHGQLKYDNRKHHGRR